MEAFGMWLYFALCVLVVLILIRIESLVGTAIKRINAIEERFDYDWTFMSAELRISAYKRGGGLLCHAEKRFSALATAINMPFTGDWLIFEVGGGKTYRGEVVGREIRYGEEASQASRDTEGTRLHMIVRIDVACDDEEGWPPSPVLAMDHYPVTQSVANDVSS
jgi:hypothetical protein